MGGGHDDAGGDEAAAADVEVLLGVVPAGLGLGDGAHVGELSELGGAVPAGDVVDAHPDAVGVPPPALGLVGRRRRRDDGRGRGGRRRRGRPGHKVGEVLKGEDVCYNITLLLVRFNHN